MVDSFMWNDNNDMLTALSDGKLKTWFYPNAVYVDKDIMTLAMQIKEATEIGKLATIKSRDVAGTDRPVPGEAVDLVILTDLCHFCPDSEAVSYAMTGAGGKGVSGGGVRGQL